MSTLSDRIVATHKAHRDWGSTAIAHWLACSDNYVRAVAHRKGLVLPKAEYGAFPSYGAKYIRERRAAAKEASKS